MSEVEHSSGCRFGDYLLLGEIGRGGMGVVWQAVHLPTNRPCALKVLLEGREVGEAGRMRFRIEAESTGRLDHPGLIKVFSAGEESGQPYLELELVEGVSLAEQLRDGLPGPRLAAEWVRQLALALGHAHGRGVLHRDVKPSNILISAAGTVKLGDFGIAKLLRQESLMPKTGGLLGTPAYMAPEVCRHGVRAASLASDIYGLGAVFYELLTGRPPFVGTSSEEILYQVHATVPPSPGVICPRLPKDLEVLCLRCLDPDPARRFATGQELAEELQRFLSGQPIRSRPVSWYAHLLGLIRTHRLVSCVTASALASLLVASVLIIGQWRRAEHLNDRLRSDLEITHLRGAISEVEGGQPAGGVARLASLVRREGADSSARRILEHWVAQGRFQLHEAFCWNVGTPVERIRWSDDAQRIAVLTTDHALKVFPKDSTNAIFQVGDLSQLPFLAMGPGGRSILVHRASSNLECWRLGEPGLNPVIQWSLGDVLQVAVDGNQRGWLALDRSGQAWRGSLGSGTGPEAIVQVPNVQEVRRLAVAEGGKRFATVTWGAGGQCFSELPEGNGAPGSRWTATPIAQSRSECPAPVFLEMSPDGTRLILADRKRLGLWDLESGRLISDPLIGLAECSRIRFFPDSRRFLAATKLGVLRVWMEEEGKLSLTQGQARCGFSDAVPIWGGEAVVTAGMDGAWHSFGHPGMLMPARGFHDAPVTSVDVSRDGQMVLSGSRDSTVRAWQWRETPVLLTAENLSGKDRFLGHLAEHGDILYQKRDRVARWGGGDQQAQVPKSPSPRVGILSMRRPDCLSVEWLDEGSVVGQGELLWTESEPMADLWSDPAAGWAITGSPKALTVYQREGDVWGPVGRVAIQDVEEVCWCPSRSIGLVRTADGEAHSIVIEAKRVSVHPLALPFPVSRLVLSPDGGRAVVVSAEGEAILLEAKPPFQRVASTRLAAPVRDVLMSPGGDWVAFASQVEVTVCGMDRLGLLARIDGLGQRTAAMAASPTAPVLALAGEGGRIGCFDPTTGLALGRAWDVRSAQPHWHRIQMRFAADGRRLTAWMEGSKSAPHRVMEVLTPSGSIPGESGRNLVLGLADYLAGRRVDEQGRVVVLDPAEIGRILKSLREARLAGLWCREWDVYAPPGGW